jgi:predicted methyltransferase
MTADSSSNLRAALATVLLTLMPLAAPAQSVDSALAKAVAGEWRSSEHRARDAARHPVESLEFWGLAPGMTILEIQPGSEAWWTEIVAPYAHATGGEFYATAADLADAGVSEQAREARNAFAARFAAHPEIYGPVHLLDWGPKSRPLPAGKFDFVLTARSIHGWIAQGVADRYFADLYRALKPGGILAVEQHRAAPGPQDPKAKSGYVTEAWVVEAAGKAGFELAARSEINANPRDTRDHPFGVWTLPPTRRTSPFGQPDDPDFDRTRYDAIGESDRMTLRFVKPR